MLATVDYLMNRGKGLGFVGEGDVASRLLANDFDPGALRPWYNPRDGRTYVTLSRGRDPISGKVKRVHIPFTTNAPVSLPRDSWKLIDTAVARAALPELRVVNQLRAAGLQYQVPNGMGVMALESMIGGDITPATISMDGIRQGDNDRPEFDTQLLPLPIIHKDFQFPLRQIAVSRRSGNPLDTTVAEMAGRKVAEEAEKLTLGVSVNNGYAYGGGTVYGLTNHPQRLTKVLTNPTAWGATGPAVLINEVVAMIEQARAAGQYGPFRLYLSPGWNLYLEADYSAQYAGVTLRQRLLQIAQISGVEIVEYLTGNLQVLLVAQRASTVRMVIGMDVTTLQWETLGGLMQNFKVMAIIVPQVRGDWNAKAGIVHGTVP